MDGDDHLERLQRLARTKGYRVVLRENKNVWLMSVATGLPEPNETMQNVLFTMAEARAFLLTLSVRGRSAK